MGFEIAEGRHEKTWSAVTALETLFTKNALLQRMELVIGTGKTLAGQYLVFPDACTIQININFSTFWRSMAG